MPRGTVVVVVSLSIAVAGVGWGYAQQRKAAAMLTPLDYIEILPAHFAAWPLEDRYLTAHVVRVLPCNWKVALEAFIESYHTVAVHPQLLTTSGDTQTEYDVYPGVRHVNRMITPVGISNSIRPAK